MSPPVVLTVSGVVPPTLAADIAEGRRPRADYVEMAAAFDADILDHGAARTSGGLAGRLIQRLGGNDAVVAWACFRRQRRYRVVFTDSEGPGLLFAAMSRFGRRRVQHVMIGHRLSTRSKVLLHRALGLRRRIDHVIVYATSQRRIAIDRLGYRDDQVTLIPFMVDTEFWRPHESPVTTRQRPMICSVGQEFRDYPTLVEAVRDVDVDVVIAAGSPWSRRDDTSGELDIPDNVSVTKLSQFELRQLYADAAFVVVPVEETDFQAGITTILEAMSMGLAVICSRTEGQTDTVVDGETGISVAPGDAEQLRAAIERLLADPELAARLGAAGRQWVVDHADIELYAKLLAQLL